MNLKITREAIRKMDIGDSIVINNRDLATTNTEFIRLGMRAKISQASLTVEDEIVPVVCATFIEVVDQERYDAFMNPKKGGRKFGSKVGPYKMKS